jgi:hypothetical protein
VCDGSDSPLYHHGHHGSHRNLLWSPADPVLARPGINAIFVPTARPPAYLIEVAKLAVALECPLITMHSGRWTSAARTATRLRSEWVLKDLDLIAIDVPAEADLRLPRWETTQALAKTVLARRTDVSAKRNLALMLSHLMNWPRILFLDDDITELNPEDVLDASGLLGSYNAVGLRVGGMLDNSVVCHAYREAGGQQQTFIGGGALAIAVDRCDSFFPDIYNEDWFFLLDGKGSLQLTAATGHVRQYPYDPFRNPDRARAEEFGDVLAEGIYWLLDQGGSITDADEKHWSSYLKVRNRFIFDVLDMVRAMTPQSTRQAAERDRMMAALKGALGRLTLITPALCDRYLRAWSADRRQWHNHIKQLEGGGLSRTQALHALTKPGAPKLAWEVNQRRPARTSPATAGG